MVPGVPVEAWFVEVWGLLEAPVGSETVLAEKAEPVIPVVGVESGVAVMELEVVGDVSLVGVKEAAVEDVSVVS